MVKGTFALLLPCLVPSAEGWSLKESSSRLFGKTVDLFTRGGGSAAQLSQQSTQSKSQAWHSNVIAEQTGSQTKKSHFIAPKMTQAGQSYVTPAQADSQTGISDFIARLEPGTSQSNIEAQSKSQSGKSVVTAAAKQSNQGDSQSDARFNLCDAGKLLPELYLVGSQKAGTTTFASDMEKVGVLHVGDWKEFHFFDKFSNMTEDRSDVGIKAKRAQWLKKLHPCPGSAAGRLRKVMADFTPSNLRSVPLPEGTRPTGTHWGLWFLSHNANNTDLTKYKGHEMNLPKILTQFYPERHIHRITFVVMLREGLARMQSAWYSASRTDDTDKTLWQQCFDCKSNSFREAFERTLNRAEQQPPVYDDWLWASMYARQIPHWLQHFWPSQFFFIPFREYVVKGAKARICNTLTRRMSLRVDCNLLLKSNGKHNAHDHPSLEEDATPSLLRRFRVLMNEENQRLVELLTRMQNSGATLPGLWGKVEVGKVGQWLEAGW